MDTENENDKNSHAIKVGRVRYITELENLATYVIYCSVDLQEQDAYDHETEECFHTYTFFFSSHLKT